MRSIVQAWQRFWFGPQSPVDLAICRIIFFGGLLWQRGDDDAARWAKLGETFWFPISAFRTFSIPLLDGSTLHWMHIVWTIALAAACVGLWSRISMGVAAILGFYLIGLPHNFGKTHHSDAIVIFILAAFALSRAGDKWSIDGWLARRKGVTFPAESGEYRWPIRVAWLGWILLYFAAGISKLRNAGLEWAISDSFRNVLLEHHYTHQPIVDWGLTLAEYPAIYMTLGVGTLVIEALCPIALFHPWARAVFAPSLAMMQFGIWLVLGVKFPAFLLVFAFWVPWEASYGLARRLLGRPRSRPYTSPA